MLTPSTTTPRPRNRSCIFISEGSSSTHGGHHVAQKFSTSTCPRNWFRFTFRSESCRLKSLAAEPTCCGLDPVLQPVASRHADRARTAKYRFTSKIPPECLKPTCGRNLAKAGGTPGNLLQKNWLDPARP